MAQEQEKKLASVDGKEEKQKKEGQGSFFAPSSKEASSPAIFSDSQGRIKILMSTLGYPSNIVTTQGFCYGIAMMAMQAHLAGEHNLFVARLNKFLNVLIDTDEKLKKYLAEVEIELAVRATIVAEIKKKLEITATKDTERKEFKQINAAVYAAFNKVYPEGMSLLDLRAFFDGIIAYQETQSDSIATLQLLQPKKLEEQKGIVRVKPFSGIYTQAELTNYFSSLQKILSEFKGRYSIVLHSRNHSITINWDAAEKKWALVDPNLLPVQYFSNAADVARNIFWSFNFSRVTNEYCAIGSQIYTPGISAAQLSKLLSTWDENSLYTEPLKNVAQRVDTESGDSGLIMAAEVGDYSTAIKLLRAGAAPNLRSRDGRSALSMAVYYKRPEMVRILCEFGADPNRQDEDGYSELHYAVLQNSPEIVRILCEFGANPNLQNRDGDSALDLAVLYNRHEMVRIFREFGADPNQQDTKGDNALQRARRNNSSDIISIFTADKRDITKKLTILKNLQDAIDNFYKEYQQKKYSEPLPFEIIQLQTIISKNEKKMQLSGELFGKDRLEDVKYQNIYEVYRQCQLVLNQSSRDPLNKKHAKQFYQDFLHILEQLIANPNKASMEEKEPEAPFEEFEVKLHK